MPETKQHRLKNATKTIMRGTAMSYSKQTIEQMIVIFYMILSSVFPLACSIQFAVYLKRKFTSKRCIDTHNFTFPNEFDLFWMHVSVVHCHRHQQNTMEHLMKQSFNGKHDSIVPISFLTIATSIRTFFLLIM